MMRGLPFTTNQLSGTIILLTILAMHIVRQSRYNPIKVNVLWTNYAE